MPKGGEGGKQFELLILNGKFLTAQVESKYISLSFTSFLSLAV